MRTKTSRSTSLGALLALAAGMLLAPGLAAPAAADSSGSLTLVAHGMVDGEAERVSGACFDVYGIENGSASMEVRRGVCMVNTNELVLTNLPRPSSGRYLIQQTQAPGLVLADELSERQEVQFGRHKDLEVPSGGYESTLHHRAGGVVVTATGPVEEKEDSDATTFTPCFEITRLSPHQHMGRHCPGSPVLDLEPDVYAVRTLERDGYLSSTVNVGIESGVTQDVNIHVALAPDYVVTLQDEHGTPLLGACYDLLALDVADLQPGYRVASRCDSWPVNDGMTTFEDLLPGRYTLQQWAGPDGYPLAEDREVSVSAWILCGPDTCPPPNELTLTASLPGQPPVVVDDAVSTAEDTPLTGYVLANDSDADGDALTATLTSRAQHGEVSLAADGTFSYTPAADFFGTDSFGYTAAADGDEVSGTVSVTVTPVNDAPVASEDTANTASATPVAVDVLANDTDVEGDSLTASVATQPAGGSVTVSAGELFYTPRPGFSGVDVFTYSVSDGHASGSGTVTVTVAPPPLAPVPAALAAVEAAISALPPVAQGPIDAILDQVTEHIDTGRASCAHAGRLATVAASTRFISWVGVEDAAALGAAAQQLRTALGCTRI